MSFQIFIAAWFGSFSASVIWLNKELRPAMIQAVVMGLVITVSYGLLDRWRGPARRGRNK